MNKHLAQGSPTWLTCLVVGILGCLGWGADAEAAEASGIVSRRPELITPAAEAAIKKALSWLAKNQSRDGSWRSGGRGGQYPTVMTALAGLALLASGSTPVEGKYAKNVRLAVDHLLKQARPSGVIAQMGMESRSMYGHGFSMLFLGEVYGLETDPLRQKRIQRVLRNAVRLTTRSQSKMGGWLYSPDSGGDEGSVTVTQIQGLRACRNAGIKVPKTTVDRAGEYIRKSACKDGSIAYRASSGGMRARGGRPPITAAAVATLYNAGQYENPVAIGALKYTMNLLEKNAGDPWKAYRGHAFYSMLYASQALWVSGDKNWKTYFPKIRDGLITKQQASGAWNGDHVGNTYGTAIGLIILQLPYQYLPVLQR